MRELGLSKDRIALTDGHLAPNAAFSSIEELIQSHGIYNEFVEHRLGIAQAKTAIAFLCFSSGTTGAPKVSILSTYHAP